METYIVRFYRRALSTADDAVGTVEHVGSGRRAGFTGGRELLERLLSGGDGAESGVASPDPVLPHEP
jgi:hypothetical protein